MCLKKGDIFCFIYFKKNLFQELYVFFQKHVLGKKIERSDSPVDSHFLTQPTVDRLKSIIVSDPCLGDSIIRALMTERESNGNKNDLLQGIFIKSINYLLDQHDTDSHVGEDNNADKEVKDKSENGPEASRRANCAHNKEKVLEILAYYDPLPYWNYLDLRSLLFRLIKLAVLDKDDENIHGFTVDGILSVLCGRTTPYLLDEFSKIYFEVRFVFDFFKMYSGEEIGLGSPKLIHFMRS